MCKVCEGELERALAVMPSDERARVRLGTADAIKYALRVWLARHAPSYGKESGFMLSLEQVIVSTTGPGRGLVYLPNLYKHLINKDLLTNTRYDWQMQIKSIVGMVRPQGVKTAVMIGD